METFLQKKSIFCHFNETLKHKSSALGKRTRIILLNGRRFVKILGNHGILGEIRFREEKISENENSDLQ